jgi:hypothetical protein
MIQTTKYKLTAAIKRCFGRFNFFDNVSGACFTKELTITITFYPAHYSLILAGWKTVLIILKRIKTNTFKLDKFKWNN